MGEEWDKFGGKPNPRGEYVGAGGMERYFKGNKPIYSWSSSELLNYQSWTTAWAREALRVLKPGASMLVMGGTRTYHRMTCGVEDAGFTVKDTVLWCYNSGLPKSQNLGMMFDKRECRRRLVKKLGRIPTKVEFKGAWKLFSKVIGEKKFWGHNAGSGAGSFSKNKYEGQTGIVRFEPIYAPVTPEAKEWNGFKIGGLKPSYEPIVWAVKPPEGPYVKNVLKHGVGAINVDACRIPLEDGYKGITRLNKNPETGEGDLFPLDKTQYDYAGATPQGRYPANMVRTDRFEDGYDRFYFVPKASRAERNEGLDSSFINIEVLLVLCENHTTREEELVQLQMDMGRFRLKVTGEYGILKKKGIGWNTTSFGKIITEGFQKDFAFTTKTGTNLTTISQISDWLTRLLTKEYEADVKKSMENGGNLAGSVERCNTLAITMNEKMASALGVSDVASGMQLKIKLKEEKFRCFHPTVKPISLMEHLIKLVTREGQIVLDPFVGSGTTCIAARKLRRKHIGFDNNPEYIEIAKRRLAAVPERLERWA